MFVCHFVDPKLVIEKDGGKEEGDIDLEIGGPGTCCTLVLKVQEDLKQGLTSFSFS